MIYLVIFWLRSSLLPQNIGILSLSTLKVSWGDTNRDNSQIFRGRKLPFVAAVGSNVLCVLRVDVPNLHSHRT
jgi:hypothetical protein